MVSIPHFLLALLGAVAVMVTGAFAQHAMFKIGWFAGTTWAALSAAASLAITRLVMEPQLFADAGPFAVFSWLLLFYLGAIFRFRLISYPVED